MIDSSELLNQSEAAKTEPDKPESAANSEAGQEKRPQTVLERLKELQAHDKAGSSLPTTPRATRRTPSEAGQGKP